MKHSPGFLSIVRSAKRLIKEIAPAETLRRMKKKNPPLIIDVREDHEWEKGHIAGARHLGRGIIERDIEELVPDPSTEIILYCGGGYRSALAADNLRKMGYRNVFSMKGGWRRWNTNRYPIVGRRSPKH